MLDFLYWFAKSQLSGFLSFLSLKLSSVTKLGNYLASALSRSLPLALHNEALLKCKIYNSKFTTGTRFLPHFVKWRVPLPCQESLYDLQTQFCYLDRIKWKRQDIVRAWEPCRPCKVWFQKISILPPQGRSFKIPRQRGDSKTVISER